MSVIALVLWSVVAPAQSTPETAPDQAIQRGQTAHYRARRANDPARAARRAQQVSSAWCTKGNTCYQSGLYLQGVQCARTGLGWLDRSATDVDTLRLQLLSLLASSYGRVPLADSAAYWFARTGEYLARHPLLRQRVPDDVCGYYMGHAYFLSRTGDARRAFDYLQVAADVARQAGNRRLLAIADNYLGNYFFAARDFDRADGYYRRALGGYEAGSGDQCWGYVILGNNDRAAGRPAAGWKNLRVGQQAYKKQLARQPASRDIDFEIQSNYYAAECQRALSHPRAATEAYRRCMAVHQKNYGTRGEFMAGSWIGLSSMAQQQSQFQTALQYARQGVNASRYRVANLSASADYIGTVLNEKTLYEALRLEADLWRTEWQTRRATGALANAVTRYDQALQVAARLRRNLIPQESKFFLSNNVAACVDQAIASSFDLAQLTGHPRDKNRLFGLIERHRMMTTADLLHEKHRLATAVPARVITREQALRQQKTDLEKAIAGPTGGPYRDSLQRQLHARSVVVYQFLDSLERAYPRYYALKYNVNTPDIARVQQTLPGQTAYVSYYVGQGYLICFLIGPSGSHVSRIALPRQFTRTTDQLWQAIRRPPGMFAYTGQRHATALYNWLIRPVQPRLQPFRRLIIARDGPLHHIPFELLQPADTTADYLGNHFAISYGYSAELTFSSVSKTVVTNLRTAGFAPYSTTAPYTPAPGLQLLPWSLAEIQAWGGQLFTGRRATKRAFLAAIPQQDVVVLATHAVADEQTPEQSFIAFRAGGSDSLLRATEIINLGLSHLQLVVLSACEGNTGALQSGEGLLSLARAFRLAGCQTILTTSWQASDESTATLTTLFQRYLATGLPTDLALQRARADFLTDKRFRQWGHPYHWANFSLIGPPVTLYQRSVWPVVAGWTAGSMALVLSLWLLRQRRPTQSRQPR